MRLIDADELKKHFLEHSNAWVEVDIAPTIKIAFLCDEKKCNCCDSDCMHTLDIRHAISFKEVNEQQYMEKSQTIDAEPVKHGEWEEEKDGWYGGQGCRCSSCGYGYSYKAYHEPYEFDFCPNCGAKMDKEREE